MFCYTEKNEIRPENIFVNNSSFEQVVKSSAFIDKSLFIKYFLEKNKQSIITAPRLFGKSTNLNMLKKFLEITVDSNGNSLNRFATDNYKLFAGNELQIFKEKSFFGTNFGVYPVIHLDFKPLNTTCYEEFTKSFRNLIGDLYAEHIYLEKSKKLHEYDKRYISFFKSREDDVTGPELQHSGEILSRLMHRHFDKRCAVLLDNYDYPMMKSAFTRSLKSEEFSKIYHDLSQFLTLLLRGNQNVCASLSTGCVQIGVVHSQEGENLVHLPFSETKDLIPFYGFSQQEVESLVAKFHKTDQLKNIVSWYNGYRVEGSEEHIYCPFSILQYLASSHFQPYWTKKVRIDPVLNLFNFKIMGETIKESLKDGGMSIPKYGLIMEYDLHSIKKLTSNLECFSENKNEYTDLILHYLTQLGFYTGKIIVPNNEIQMRLKKYLDEFGNPNVNATSTPKDKPR